MHAVFRSQSTKTGDMHVSILLKLMYFGHAYCNVLQVVIEISKLLM